MSDQSQDDKTERATPKRIDDARQKGQLPRSRELSGAAVVLAVSGVIAMRGPAMLGEMAEALRFALTQPARYRFEEDAEMLAAIGRVAQALFLPLVPVLLVAVLAAVLAALAIGGWNLSGKAMLPDFAKLNPLKGLQRMVSLNAAVELLKAIGKALLVGGVATGIVMATSDHWLGLGRMPVSAAIMDGFALAMLACVGSGAAYLLVGLLDAPYQMWKHQRDLRMTRQETRDESKESEGRPEVKSRLRQMQQELARGRMMEAVPQADVILVNPVHVAVALRYDAKRHRAPRVVAKGAGEVAEVIRKLAREHRVPVLRSPPLARVLYRTVDLGGEIPADLFSAIAQVLTWVYQVRRQPGGTHLEPPQPDIPPHLEAEAAPWR